MVNFVIEYGIGFLTVAKASSRSSNPNIRYLMYARVIAPKKPYINDKIVTIHNCPEWSWNVTREN